jgi:hypothetical protein
MMEIFFGVGTTSLVSSGGKEAYAGGADGVTSAMVARVGRKVAFIVTAIIRLSKRNIDPDRSRRTLSLCSLYDRRSTLVTIHNKFSDN